jgi:hypothetical protein
MLASVRQYSEENMTKKFILAFLATAVFVSSSLFGVAPRPAQADTNSTIAIAAAAIVGILLFDSNNRPYYYRSGRPVYVSNQVASYYVQQRDPRWYSQHRGDWQSNRGQFSRDWNNDHNNGGHNGQGNGNNHGNGNWHGH